MAPGLDYESVPQEIVAGLEELRDPETGELVVAHVHRREDIYRGPYLDCAPDLVVEWHDYGYWGRDRVNPASRQLFQVEDTFEFSSLPLTGSHRLAGILIANGAPVRAGARVEGAHITDLAPTILELIGVGDTSREFQGRTKLLTRLDPTRPAEEEGNTNRLLIDMDTMVEVTVLHQTFTVIRRNHDKRVLLQPETKESMEQSSDLGISEGDFSIIGADRQPERVSTPPAGLEARSERIGRHIGIVRIEVMNEEKKRLIRAAILLQPTNSPLRCGVRPAIKDPVDPMPLPDGHMQGRRGGVEIIFVPLKALRISKSRIQNEGTHNGRSLVAVISKDLGKSSEFRLQRKSVFHDTMRNRIKRGENRGVSGPGCGRRGVC